jgi:hypothetical protein
VIKKGQGSAPIEHNVDLRLIRHDGAELTHVSE